MASEEPLLQNDDNDIFKKEPLNWFPAQGKLCSPGRDDDKCIYQGDLPECLQDTDWYDQKTAALMNAWNPQGALPMRIAAAPAVKKVYIGNAILWLSWLVAPFLLFLVSTCPDYEEDLSNQANISPLIWLPFGLIISISLYIERHVLRHIIPGQVLLAPDFTFLGGVVKWKDHPYLYWRFFMLFLSGVSKASILTNSLFMAKLLKSRSCAGDSFPIDLLWAAVMKTSTLRHIPVLNTLSFTAGGVLLWSFMCLQILWPLLYTFPIKPNAFKAGDPDPPHIDYTLPETQGEAFGMCFAYTTPLDKEQNHGAALMILADSARMTSVTYQDSSFARLLLERYLDTKPKNWEKLFLHVGYHQVVHGVQSFLTVGLLECTLQLNLQVSFLALQANLQNPDDFHFKLFSIFSLSLNMCVFVMKLLNAKSLFELFVWLRRKAQGEDRTIMTLFAPRARATGKGFLQTEDQMAQMEGEEKEYNEQCMHMWVKLRRCFKLFLLWTVLYCLAFLYAFFKFISWGYCDSAMLNMNGCADLTDFNYTSLHNITTEAAGQSDFSLG